MTNTVKNTPIVIRDVMDLGNEKHILKCRIVKYQHPLIGLSLPFFDIRRFWTLEKNGRSGYGNGISLSVKDLYKLKRHIDGLIKELEHHQTIKEI